MSSILPTWRAGLPPGVYARAPQTAQVTPTVRMDIPAFVGLTSRGPVGEPVEVDGWPSFTERFGLPGSGRLLPECVAQFFANGGVRCVVVRHLEPGALLSYPLEGFATGGAELRAATPGRWLAATAARVRFTLERIPGLFSLSGAMLEYAGPALEIGMTLRLVAVDGAQTLHRITDIAPTATGQELTLTPPAGAGLVDVVHEVRFDLEVELPGASSIRRFTGLTLDPLHPDHPLHRLAADPDLRWADDGSPLTPTASGTHRVPTAGIRTVPRISLADQLDAEQPHLVTRAGMVSRIDVLTRFDQAHPVEPVTMVHVCDLVHVDRDHQPEADTVHEIPISTGATFVPCEDVPRVAVPNRGLLYANLDWKFDSEGIADAQSSIVAAQQQSRRIALLDVPPHLPADQVAVWRHRFDTDRAAAFAPWLVISSGPDRAPKTVPPGGAVAAIWAESVRARGVGWAPANRALRTVAKPFAGQQLPTAGRAHALHLNLIWPTPEGPTLLGARTLSKHPDWVHINVRRTIDWLTMQLPIDHAWAVFEPNDRHLRRRIGLGLRRRLRGLYDANALAGETPEQAFFYEVGESDRNQMDYDAGMLRVSVGVSPSVPMEFLVVELLLDTAGQQWEVRGG